MFVAIICYDKPNHLDLRLKTRPTHLSYIENSNVRLTYGGPLLTDNGEAPMGSLFVGEFDSLDAARAFNKNDPYSLAGLFEKVLVHPTRKVFPAA
ncbi:MAG: YciI family protein [Rhodospirillaceae bacterium]|nr:YciI family protein [Rhodospirillaceae bacterium]